MNKNCVKVTADDYGYCHERNIGILKAIRLGVVKSVSVLVNGSCLDISNLSSNTNLKIGLHLNLTEGKPVSNLLEIPSLVHEKGFFFPKADFEERQAKFNVEEIEKEIHNQISKFESIFCFLPHYIDGHQHCHIFPVIRDCFMKCLISHNISETRIPYELGVESVEWIKDPQRTFFQTVQSNSLVSKEVFTKNGIRVPKYFIGLSVMSTNLNVNNLKRAFEIVKKDFINRKHQGDEKEELLLEIMSHPGYASVTDQAGCGLGPDAFAKSDDRVYEMKFLCSSEVLKFLHDVNAFFNTHIGQPAY